MRSSRRSLVSAHRVRRDAASSAAQLVELTQQLVHCGARRALETRSGLLLLLGHNLKDAITGAAACSCGAMPCLAASVCSLAAAGKQPAPARMQRLGRLVQRAAGASGLDE